MIAYLVFICILGVPVMITEMSLGRKTHHDPVLAYQDVHPRAGIVGMFGVLAAFFILSYYSVIGGWILKYMFSYITTFKPVADFEAFIGTSWEPVFWHMVFMFLTAFICYTGLGGIERVSKFMMPALFLLLIVIIVRSVTLPGASAGLRFIFYPDFSAFNISSVSAALGQVFYSLSLCMGITITYGSYLGARDDIPKSCISVASLDTFIAILAGIAIFPAVFAFRLEPGQGPGLIFGTLPKVFSAISGGSMFAILFFSLVFFAAVTSAIALLEVVVSFTMDSWGWSREKSTILLGTVIFLLGIPSSLSFGILADVKILNYNFFDLVGMLTDNILLPLGGVFMCYFIGWKWSPYNLVDEIEQNGVVFKAKKLWVFCVRFITPVLVGIVTITGFSSIYHVIF